LATIAKDLDIAVLAARQLSRGVEGRENKRPSLADLRGSDSIEEDARMIALLYRVSIWIR
jgi:replicative DNA helicase